MGALEPSQAEGIVGARALANNDLLPQIPLWDRYGNNPARDTRFPGWPADGDPVFQNGTYNDPFVIVLMLTGQLQPK